MSQKIQNVALILLCIALLLNGLEILPVFAYWGLIGISVIVEIVGLVLMFKEKRSKAQEQA